MRTLFISSVLTLAVSLTVSPALFGQEVFGQKGMPNTLSPVEIGYEELPEAVRSVVERSEFRISELDKVYKVGKRKAQREDHYMVRFKRGTEYHDVYIDNEGNVIDPQDEDNESREADKD